MRGLIHLHFWWYELGVKVISKFTRLFIQNWFRNNSLFLSHSHTHPHTDTSTWSLKLIWRIILNDDAFLRIWNRKLTYMIKKLQQNTFRNKFLWWWLAFNWSHFLVIITLPDKIARKWKENIRKTKILIWFIGILIMRFWT